MPNVGFGRVAIGQGPSSCPTARIARLSLSELRFDRDRAVNGGVEALEAVS